MGGKLYALWTELNSVSLPQIRMSAFNGNVSAPAWTPIDAGGDVGFNRSSARAARSPHVLTTQTGMLMTWWEADLASNTGKVRVASYNGNDANPAWTPIDGNADGGISRFPSRTMNPLPTGYSGYPRLIVSGNHLYLAWSECDFLYGSCYSAMQLSVARLLSGP